MSANETAGMRYPEDVPRVRKNAPAETAYALSDDGKNLLVDREKVLGFSQKLISLLEVRARRAWAAKIREEFGKYHDHSDGGECGACGAIQAANFMDPDVADG